MGKELKRGDIVYIDLGQHPKSSVQSGIRPCLVVSNAQNNRYAKTINVLPFSSKAKNMPVHVMVEPKDVKGHFVKTSECMAEQITTVDKNKIIVKVGHIHEESEVMKKINEAIRLQLALA